jgi:hypothetical protein
MLLVGLNNMDDGLPTDLEGIYTDVRLCGCAWFILAFLKKKQISKIS